MSCVEDAKKGPMCGASDTSWAAIQRRTGAWRPARGLVKAVAVRKMQGSGAANMQQIRSVVAVGQ